MVQTNLGKGLVLKKNPPKCEKLIPGTSAQATHASLLGAVTKNKNEIMELMGNKPENLELIEDLFNQYLSKVHYGKGN